MTKNRKIKNAQCGKSASLVAIGRIRFPIHQVIILPSLVTIRALDIYQVRMLHHGALNSEFSTKSYDMRIFGPQRGARVHQA